MKISKSIILPEWESIASLEQAGDILHKITEAMKDHQIENYEDGVANFRRVTTGRIQSKDGETYFDLDSGVIKGEIVFRPGSSGLDNIAEASPNDWDNAFKLANAVKGDDDFTLISGGKIIANSIVLGAFTSDVTARMFSEGAKEEIESWMRTSGEVTYIDGGQIFAGSITLSGLGTTVIEDGKIVTDLLTATNIRVGYLQTVQFRCGGGTSEDILFEDSGIRMYDRYTPGSYKIALYKDVDFFIFQRTSTTVCQLFGLPTFQLVADTVPFSLYSTGQLQLPNLGSLPTENLAEGQLCMSAGILHYYQDSAWHSLVD